MKRARGFTLLEVLVALAILAIALSAVIKTVSTHIQHSVYLRDRTLAHWVAMNKLSELQLADDFPAAGSSDGRSVMADHEWFWTLRIETTPDKDVNQVNIDVRMDRDADAPLSSLQGYLGRAR